MWVRWRVTFLGFQGSVMVTSHRRLWFQRLLYTKSSNWNNIVEFHLWALNACVHCHSKHSFFTCNQRISTNSIIKRNSMKGILIENLMQKGVRKERKACVQSRCVFLCFACHLLPLSPLKNIFGKYNTVKQCALINCVWAKRAVGWENCVRLSKSG